ncbi:MAG: multidrug efflux RND transporter permease subunit [Pirellulales bacterium]|nr:multidrug efflux RND transporter permease subunit [Pirellulales bacterium]
MARFFIDRPIFAAVVSIVITLLGAVAVNTLPIAQYPEITPPTVQVTCIYPGASAKVVADTVAAPIEQQVNGVENMLYMSSQCTNDGTYALTVTFKLGTNLDMAQVLVQNRVALALPTLPDVVKATGVSTKKKSPNILLVVNLVSPDGSYDQLRLSNYATVYLRDQLARLNGVGDVTLLGQQDFSMRVWLDPERLATRNLTASDVVNALREQNVQVAAGQIGQQPVPAGQEFQYTMSTLGRLTEVEQFEQIILKTGADQQVTRLADVGRIELAAKNRDITCTLDGQPSVGMAVFQLPGANALEVADEIEATMRDLAERFPSGLAYQIVYDTTPFIDESIREVFKTLRDAILLVAIVVLVFLQSWRATIIPLIAVPVSIVGTFAALAAFGFSLNNLSLFGLVLAIGIVVDDAIVVVEAVQHHLEHGLSARDAALKAMGEVTGPVVATALVLCAVFIPSAFLSGITGQFFRQFAVTIAVSTVISMVNSLTLSPALSALLLKPPTARRDPLEWVLNLALGWFFKIFNGVFGAASGFYARVVGLALRTSLIVLLLYGGLLYLTYYSLSHIPTGFIPMQDKGYLLVNVQLPDAASLERTQAVLARVDQLARATPGVRHAIGVAGQSILLGANGSNFGSAYIILDEFHQRHGAELSADAIAARLRAQFFRDIAEAQVAVFGAPPVDGLGNAGGYKLMIEDRGDLGLGTLQAVTDDFIATGNQQPGLVGMFTAFRADTPQLYVDVDRTKCKSLGVPLGEVFNTLQVFLGGYYVNDFNRFGRTWQVNLQADAPFRLSPEVVRLLKVRNANGEMVPLGTLAEVRDDSGPVMITRYNMFPAAAINGSLMPGVSTGEGIATIDALARRELPQAIWYDWTELTYLQILAGNTALLVFAGATVLVFLVLAAQYESWSLPLAVILVVPVVLLCSVIGIAIGGLDVVIFTQIGFVVLVGLASKNAILIVEFAKQKHEQGATAREATLEACRLRLRPILMTSFAFILGVVPLVLASGAGAEMRYALGLAVFSGMLGVTLFGLLLTPVFYYVVTRLFGRKQPRPVAPTDGRHVDVERAAAVSTG